MNDPLTVSGLITALITAIGAMWRKLASDHARLERRAAALEEKDEKRDLEIGEMNRVLAIFQACPAENCPAIEGLRRAGSHPVHPPTDKTHIRSLT